MNAIDTFPPDLDLRAALPQFRPESQVALIRWALVQPGSMPWLLARAAAYWERATPAAMDGASHNTHHARIEATCALELLRWRIAAATDRACIEHVNAAVAETRCERQPDDEKGQR